MLEPKGTPPAGTPTGTPGDKGTPSDAPKTKLVVDGQDVEVTQKELEAGYLRQADYTKKTTAVSEERKALDAAKADYNVNVEKGVDDLLKRYATIADAGPGGEPPAPGSALREALGVEIPSGVDGTGGDDANAKLQARLNTLEARDKARDAQDAKLEQERFMQNLAAEHAEARQKYPILSDERIKNVNSAHLIDSLVWDSLNKGGKMTVDEAAKTVADGLKETIKAAEDDYVARKSGTKPPQPSGGGGTVPSTPAREFNKDSIDSGECEEAAAAIIERRSRG